MEATIALIDSLDLDLKRAQLPACVLIPRGEGGLDDDSVAICYQIRYKINIKKGIFNEYT